MIANYIKCFFIGAMATLLVLMFVIPTQREEDFKAGYKAASEIWKEEITKFADTHYCERRI